MLGIDPGLACTGIGIIVRHAMVCDYIHHDVIRTSPDTPLEQRLAHISKAVAHACTQYKPQCASIERTFVNVNAASSLALGQARGAAMSALGLAELPVHELAPSTVKKSITGDASATKKLVATMVRSILKLETNKRLSADATDALAIALCYALQRRFLRRRR